jgi:hypothetical protein
MRVYAANYEKNTVNYEKNTVNYEGIYILVLWVYYEYS